MAYAATKRGKVCLHLLQLPRLHLAHISSFERPLRQQRGASHHQGVTNNNTSASLNLELRCMNTFRGNWARLVPNARKVCKRHPSTHRYARCFSVCQLHDDGRAR